MCAQPSVCLGRLMNTSLRIGEEMRDTSMLCFTSSTSLAVLQLGEICPMPWAVLPGVSGAQLLSVPLDPVLSLPCARWNPAYSIIVALLMSALHSNSPHKASFLPPLLKSTSKVEGGGKSRSRMFVFLTFKSNAPDRQRVIIHNA